jgi:predicted nuclease of predicted toxin-antitoxin system
MRILFDQGTPVPLRRALHPHTVDTASELGWSRLRNGELLASAEEAGYEMLVTTDQNLRYQQNLKGRRISILVLKTTSWPRMKTKLTKIVETLETISAGGYREVDLS